MVDLMNQILMERLVLSSSGDVNLNVDSSTIAEETSLMVINDGSALNSASQAVETFPGTTCDISSSKSINRLVTQADCLLYLMECYERVTTVEKAYPKVDKLCWDVQFPNDFSFVFPLLHVHI